MAVALTLAQHLLGESGAVVRCSQQKNCFSLLRGQGLTWRVPLLKGTTVALAHSRAVVPLLLSLLERRQQAARMLGATQTAPFMLPSLPASSCPQPLGSCLPHLPKPFSHLAFTHLNRELDEQNPIA